METAGLVTPGPAQPAFNIIGIKMANDLLVDARNYRPDNTQRVPTMQSDAKTVEEYLSELEPTRREAISAVRSVILENLPDGYEEVMQYGMISYVVPSSVVPDTYNGQPLMYIALASQKQYMSLYLTTVYADPSLSDWFKQRYLATGKKLNMGKSCVRFRKLENLPLDLVAEVTALTPLAKFVEETKSYRSA